MANSPSFDLGFRLQCEAISGQTREGTISCDNCNCLWSGHCSRRRQSVAQDANRWAKRSSRLAPLLISDKRHSASIRTTRCRSDLEMTRVGHPIILSRIQSLRAAGGSSGVCLGSAIHKARLSAARCLGYELHSRPPLPNSRINALGEARRLGNTTAVSTRRRLRDHPPAGNDGKFCRMTDN